MIAEPAPRPSLEVLEGGVGAALAAERRAQRQTVEQVASATRIRRGHVEAIERDDLAALPGAIYARGYIRAYALHLGLDPEPLLARLAQPAAPAAAARPALSLARLAPRLPAGLVVTAPMVMAAALVAGIALFASYAWYELRSAQLEASPAPVATAVSPPPIASPAPLPSAAAGADPAAPATLHPIAIAIKATELVWVQVTVDGKPAYGAAGRMLQPGTEDVFVGQKVKISAGKPSLLVSVSGGDYQPLGTLNKEYSAQT